MPSPPTVLDYRRRVCQAMNYISAHLDEELTLDTIASVAAFSPFHFHRIFSIVVGESLSAFIRRLRLEAAASALCGSSHEDITGIALRYGFSSSQNFAKAFRLRFGCSPTEWKLRKQGNIDRKEEHIPLLHAAYVADDLILPTPGRNLPMNAEIKIMPEFHVAYVRKLGPYGPDTCAAAFGELMAWAAPRGHLAGPMLGLYWDSPEITAPDKLRTDACVVVPEGTSTEGAVALQTVPGGKHAVCHFECPASGFPAAWNEAFAWLVANGLECADRAIYEFYHNNGDEHPEKAWIFDICIPLR